VRAPSREGRYRARRIEPEPAKLQGRARKTGAIPNPKAAFKALWRGTSRRLIGGPIGTYGMVESCRAQSRFRARNASNVAHRAIWLHLAERSRVFLCAPPMHPTVQPNGHVCAAYITVTSSPNFKPKLGRSSLNVWLAWALAVGGLPLWGANHPEVPERESPWIVNRHATVIGDRDSDKEPGFRQTTGGVSKPACLESRCR